MYHLLIVFTNAVSGRDQAFNDWYTHVHIRDVMGLRGAIAVQRFRTSNDQLPGKTPTWGYLALYEGSNVRKLVEGHAPAFTHEMPISSALDLNNPYDVFFDTVAYRTSSAAIASDGDVIIDMVAGSLDESGLAAYREQCISFVDRPGFTSAQVMTRSDEQLMDVEADIYGHSCLWRVSDRGLALNSLEEHRRQYPSSNLTVCFQPIISRLEAGDVVHAMPEERAHADLVRQSLDPADLLSGMPR